MVLNNILYYHNYHIYIQHNYQNILIEQELNMKYLGVYYGSINWIDNNICNYLLSIVMIKHNQIRNITNLYFY